MTALDARRLPRRTVLKWVAATPAVSALTLHTARASTPVAGAAPATALVAGNTAFAFATYDQLRGTTDGNLLFSPYSISEALAMTWAGAAGETATQMANALSFTLGQPALHEAFHALDADLTTRGSGSEEPARTLRIANALWGEQTYPFSDTYNDEIERYYGAGLQRTDFINAPEDARGQVNDWVAEHTEDRIQNIVPEGVITSITRLVLANAISFYGPWQSQFEPDATSDDTFHLLDGGTVTVPFMFQQEHLPYASGDGYQAIELPYDGSGFALTVILPDEGQFETVEAELDAGTLATAVDQLAYTEVLLYLPKFEFDFGASVADTLQALGMTDAFNPDAADFTGMVEGTPAEPLFISDVLHKAFISVDENGTEAAAATVVIGVGAGAPTQEPPEVRIDRPFLFAIRDTDTGTLLFLGRVMDPSTP